MIGKMSTNVLKIITQNFLYTRRKISHYVNTSNLVIMSTQWYKDIDSRGGKYSQFCESDRHKNYNEILALPYDIQASNISIVNF